MVVEEATHFRKLHDRMTFRSVQNANGFVTHETFLVGGIDRNVPMANLDDLGPHMEA